MSGRSAKELRRWQREAAVVVERLERLTTSHPRKAWASVVLPVALAAFTPVPYSGALVALAVVIALWIVWHEKWCLGRRVWVSVLVLAIGGFSAFILVPKIKQAATNELVAAVMTALRKDRAEQPVASSPLIPPSSSETMIRTVNIGILERGDFLPLPLVPVLQVTEGGNGYRLFTRVVATWQSQHRDQSLLRLPSVEDADVWRDLVEAGFWLWMAESYARHWDVQRETVSGTSGYSSYLSLYEGAEPKPQIVSAEQIRKGLGPNRFVEVISGQVAFPAGSRIVVEGGRLRVHSGSRTFAVSVPMASGNVVDRTPFGDDHIVPRFGHGLEERHATVRLTYEYPADVPSREKRWAEQLMASFHRDFDWFPIQQALRRPVP